MTDKFSVGGTVRYIEETLDKLKMRGIMIDLGTYYWTGLGSTRFAVTVSNFGNQMSPDGKVVLSVKGKIPMAVIFTSYNISGSVLHLNHINQKIIKLLLQYN